MELILRVNSASGMIPKLISYRLQLMPHLGAVHPLQIFGADYPTGNGTCERDFIHVQRPISQELTLRRSTGLTTAVKRWL